jgi:hypothetical protein
MTSFWIFYGASGVWFCAIVLGSIASSLSRIANSLEKK